MEIGKPPISVPPELAALGSGIAEYFGNHADEFKKGARVTVEIDLDDKIECTTTIELKHGMIVKYQLDSQGQWFVIDSYSFIH